MLPHFQSLVLQRGEPLRLLVTLGALEVLGLDIQGTCLPTVGQTHLAPARDVVAYFADGPDGVLQGHVAHDDRAVLQHPQHDARRPDLQESGVLAHVGITDDHVQPPVAFGVGMRFVPGIDDRPATRGGRRDAFPDVLGPLAYAVLLNFH